MSEPPHRVASRFCRHLSRCSRPNGHCYQILKEEFCICEEEYYGDDCSMRSTTPPPLTSSVTTPRSYNIVHKVTQPTHPPLTVSKIHPAPIHHSLREFVVAHNGVHGRVPAPRTTQYPRMVSEVSGRGVGRTTPTPSTFVWSKPAGYDTLPPSFSPTPTLAVQSATNPNVSSMVIGILVFGGLISVGCFISFVWLAVGKFLKKSESIEGVEETPKTEEGNPDEEKKQETKSVDPLEVAKIDWSK